MPSLSQSLGVVKNNICDLIAISIKKTTAEYVWCVKPKPNETSTHHNTSTACEIPDNRDQLMGMDVN